MSRPYRIQDRTRDKLKDLNTRVSKKKSRYRRKNDIELNDLIQTKKPGEFSTRQEVEKYVRDMERFLSRETQYVKNKNNVVFPRKEAEKVWKEIDRINKRKEREFKKIEKLQTQIDGHQLGMTVGERMKLGSKRMFQSLTPLTKSLDRFSSVKDMKRHMKNYLQQGYYKGDFLRRSDQRYKQSYLKSLERFGSLGQRLSKAINRMSLDDFMAIYYQTSGTIDIKYNYNDEDNLATKIEILERTFGLS